MKKHDAKPASKKDVRLIIRKELRRYTTKKDLQNELRAYATKKDLQNELRAYATKKDLDAMVESLEKNLVHQFRVIAENLTHDYKGIFKDRLEQHEDRLTRLELHVGFVV